MDINQGDTPISEIFVGDMGIKTVMSGGNPIYERSGGYIYIELNTKENDA